MKFATSTTNFLALASAFAVTTTTAVTVIGKDDKTKLCYDYSPVLGDLGDQCSGRSLFVRLRNHHKAQGKADNTKCKGGIFRDLKLLTDSKSKQEAEESLQYLCDDALDDAIEAAKGDTHDWSMLEAAPASIDLEEYYSGQGILNDETGNFQQTTSRFLKRPDRFNYIGTDPRKNDHYATSEASYVAGEAIDAFYKNEASSKYLTAPTVAFEGNCPVTHAAVCCFGRDRQYFDNNGNCVTGDCAGADPGDNGDLCWTDTAAGLFPYPEDTSEGDIHCHGLAWGSEGADDVNSNARWNNLAYVSLYDHLYTRGYADSLTDNPLIAGEVPMCGCVEDMEFAVARADCTEAHALTSYTLGITADGLLTVQPIAGTFALDFRACEGYDYDADITPAQFENTFNFNGADANLQARSNDLSAFYFRQYLEGLVDEAHVSAFEEVIVGYSDPTVNDGDDERNVVCKEKFETKYGQEFVEIKIAEE